MPASSQKTNDAAVAVRNLTIAFGTNVVVDDVSFDIPRGHITAIIGPNGSGKTTLIRGILGLTDIMSGDIALLGSTRRAVRHRVGYVPQRFEFDRTFPITAREFLNLARQKTTTHENLAHAVEEVGLMTSVLEQRIGTLSGGQLQRLLVAQAILNTPALLFLDEPSTGIDVAGEEALTNVLVHLKETHGTTIIMVSHDLGMVADSVDNVICMNRRLVCVGPPQQTLTPAQLSALYGAHTKPLHHGHTHH